MGDKVYGHQVFMEIRSFNAHPLIITEVDCVALYSKSLQFVERLLLFTVMDRGL